MYEINYKSNQVKYDIIDPATAAGLLFLGGIGGYIIKNMKGGGGKGGHAEKKHATSYSIDSKVL